MIEPTIPNDSAKLGAPEPNRLAVSKPLQVALIFAAFVSLFLLLRLPFLFATWDGSDGNGHHVALVLGLTNAPDGFMIARLNGVHYYSYGFPHPVPSYSVLYYGGKLLRLVVPLNQLEGSQLIFAFKCFAALIQCAVMSALLWIALRHVKSRVSILWVFVFSATPVILYGANEFQVDSTSSLAFASIFFFALMIAQFPEVDRRSRFIGLFVGSLAFGLCKNEWIFCLVLALLFTAVVYPAARLVGKKLLRGSLAPEDRDQPYLQLGVIVLGLVLGNFISYLMSPNDYTSGWSNLQRMANLFTIAGENHGAWINEINNKIPYMSFGIVAIIISLLYFFSNLANCSIGSVLALSTGGALLASYIFNSWAPLPRYFTPALLALCCAFLMFEVRAPRSNKRALIVSGAMALLVGQSALWLADWSDRYWNKGIQRVDVAQLVAPALAGNCVLITEYGYVVDRFDIDVAHIHFGRDFLNEFLKEKGRVACS